MADDFQLKTHAFLHWFMSRRTRITSKIQLGDLRHQNEGRGVVALQDIAEDEELFSVSRADILSVENSEFGRHQPGRNMLLDEEDQWISLIIVMIYEFLRGEQSPWKPYFDVLPADFNTLMFWSEDELDQLQASAVRQKIGKQSANIMFLEKIILPIRRNHSLFPAAASLTDEDMLYLAHRMGSTIMAYAFDIEKEPSQQDLDEEGYAEEEEEDLLPKGMIPMADMLNADADRSNARLFYGESIVTMKALRHIRAGEEVLNDYGPLPRADLLRRYGYITNNYIQYDVVEIPQQLVVDVFRVKASEQLPQKPINKLMNLHCTHADMREELVQQKLEYLEEYEVLEDGYDICRNAQKGTFPDSKRPEEDLFPPSLRIIMWVLDLPEDEFNAKKTSKPRSAPIDMKDKGSVRFLGLLRDICAARLDQYATSLQDDEQLAQTIEQNPPQNLSDYRKTMALHIRIGEKQILYDAMMKASGTHIHASTKHGGRAFMESTMQNDLHNQMEN